MDKVKVNLIGGVGAWSKGTDNLKSSVRDGWITLFIDNLPEDVSLNWLRNLYNKFGVVRDAFIPLKRSKVTMRRFGFIRYSCAVSTDVAITKTNGIWIEDRKLYVKKASFQDYRNNLRQRNNQRIANAGNDLESKSSRDDRGADYRVHAGIDNDNLVSDQRPSYANILK